MSNTFNIYDLPQVWDTRDLVERQDELEAIIACVLDGDPAPADYGDIMAEYEQGLEIIVEVDGYSGDTCRDGITMIADAYFEEYAKELAEELGVISDKHEWPYTCIDWEEAANALQEDYTEIEIQKEIFWYR